MRHSKLVMLLVLATAITWADSHISFPATPNDDQSNLFFDGTVFGESIQVQFAAATGDGPTFTCFYCTLDFSPGAYLGATNTAMLFSSGGWLSLTGGMDLAGTGNPWDDGNINDTDPNTGLKTKLIGGTFTGTPTISLLSQGTGPAVDSVFLFSALFDATLNEQLAQYFGFATDVLHAGMVYFDFTVPWTVAPGDPFETNLILGGILTVENLSPVPEMSSLLLLALATAGVGIAARFSRGAAARQIAV